MFNLLLCLEWNITGSDLTGHDGKMAVKVVNAGNRSITEKKPIWQNNDKQMPNDDLWKTLRPVGFILKINSLNSSIRQSSFHEGDI